MKGVTKCPDCGALLADTAQSLCPGCLIRLGITLNRPVPSQPGTGSRDDHRPSAPDPGTLPIRFGNYELLEQLASGGMGVVYKARQLSLNRVVALKMIRAGALAGPAEVKRFHSEAEAVAQLQHRHIVSIHDIGECDGQHYFSMDYIAGRTLAEVVREGPLPVHRAAGYVRAIAEAIHYAHQHGIVHRDLKPANVLLDEQDQPWITDFGLAKRLGDSVLCAPDSLLTLSGQVLGSPNYLAPEQADPKRGIVGPTSDIYALGAILYHLVTGRPPFQAESLTTLLREVIETEPIAPRLLNPSLPHDLETILLKCLEKAPGRRYATAQALADELDRLLRHEPIRARPVSWPERIWRWCQRWPVRASLASGLIGAILMGVTGIAWQWYRAEGALQLAVRAEGKAEERLWASYLAQGRANRWSNRPGRRFEGLEAVSNAAAIRPTLELRNEAIACLALPDVHMERILTVNRTQRKLALAYDARFERYAWIYVDGSIGIHQVKDDRELLRLPLQESPRFAGLQFSPDGQFLACWIQNGETNRVRVWDLSSSRLALSLPVKVRSWAYRPGTTQLAVAEGSGLIHLLDAASGLEVRQIQQAPISHIAFSPEGSRLIVSHALTPSVVLLDLERSEIVRKIQAPGGIGLMACSPDGRVLAGPCLDNRIYLWDLESERPPAILEGHTSAAIAVAFNRLGDMMASSGWDGMTRFWDTKLHRLLFSVPGGWVPIPFGANDLWLGIGSSDRETAVWRVDPARECRRLGLTSKVWEAQFTPDGQHLFTAETDGVRLWDVEANRLAEFLPLAQCRSVTIARDGLTLVASGWSGVRRYGLSSEKTTGAVRISPSEEISPLKRERACLSPDGATVLATGSAEADVLVVDLNHPQKTRRLLGHTGAAAVAASPDGRWFATATWGGTGVKIWSTQTWQPVRELEVRGNAVCHFSPQGRWLVTGSAEEYRLCKAGSWESELVIPRDRVDDMYGSMAFSADESTMAVLVGRSSPVKLLALPGGQELATFDTGPPLCFSSDGNLLATAGEDGASLFVWDLRLIQAQLRTMKLDWALPDSAKGL